MGDPFREYCEGIWTNLTSVRDDYNLIPSEIETNETDSAHIYKLEVYGLTKDEVEVKLLDKPYMKLEMVIRRKLVSYCDRKRDYEDLQPVYKVADLGNHGTGNMQVSVADNGITVAFPKELIVPGEAASEKTSKKMKKN